jgi:predicted nuclease of restriction endonuclease-like (RecB) superfamily
MSNKPARSSNTLVAPAELIGDIRRMIDDARAAAATAVNTALTILYWRVGNRINQEILKGKRAGYGAEIVSTVSRQLAAEYGVGFAEKNLRRMIQFATVFPDEKIVVSLVRQLSWTHFIALIPLKKPLQRDFYAEMCRVERWSVRALRQKIASMLYERTALSRKPDKLARLELQSLREEDRMSPDLVFRDPYLLDFLGLKGAYQEKDLEAAILRELEAFIMELGAGFSFVSRQQRITVDHDDFYLDLLFFHRDLRRLIAVELKLDKFRPDHKGQMELYLRWLDKRERKPDEATPLGIILCAGKNSEQIELLELGHSGIHVAEYLTALPPKDILKRKLHETIEHSRLVMEHRNEDAAVARIPAPKTTVKKNLTNHRRPKRRTGKQAGRQKGGGIAKKARQELENKTGKKIVTGENFLPPAAKRALPEKKRKKK